MTKKELHYYTVIFKVPIAPLYKILFVIIEKPFKKALKVPI